MKKASDGLKWYFFITLLLVALSLFSYLLQIIIFHRTEDTFFYMLQDIAFVPIQVLLVTLIISRLLNEREKKVMLKKMNMLIGAFYSEVGTQLIKYCSGFSLTLPEETSHLIVRTGWKDQDFAGAVKYISEADHKINSRKADMKEVREFLEAKRVFLLGLLANPNLLEHDSFTDLLWAVFHLTEELSARDDFSTLPDSDLDHLSGDIKRAYVSLLSEWVIYMKHLKEDYPYLFSLAVRMNPMDRESSPIVK